MYTDYNFEYGVAFRHDPRDCHRGPMRKDEAEKWIQSWIEDGGKEDLFVMIRRPIAKWKICC